MKRKIGLLFLIFFVIAIFICCTFAGFCFYFPQQYRGQISKNSTQNNISPAFVASIIKAESGYNQNAKSSAGAIGLMQLMPKTALFVAEKNNLKITEENLYNPEINILLGCLYLKMLFSEFVFSENVLCAYNAGPTKAREWLCDENYTENGVILHPPYKETANYLKNVMFYVKFYNLVW